MSSILYPDNKLRSTIIYGKFKNIDSTNGQILANGDFQRDLTVQNNIILGKELYDDTPAKNILSTNGNIIFTINKILYTIPILNLSFLNNLTSNIQTQINSINSLSSLLTTNNIFTGLNKFTNDYMEIGDKGNDYGNLRAYGDTTVSNLYINKDVQIGGIITFSQTINDVSGSVFSYIRGITDDVQEQFNKLNSIITKSLGKITIGTKSDSIYIPGDTCYIGTTLNENNLTVYGNSYLGNVFVRNDCVIGNGDILPI